MQRLQDAAAQQPPPRRQRLSESEIYPTDIIPCCCRSPPTEQRSMCWSGTSRRYLCRVCGRCVHRDRLVACMSDAMNRTGGPPVCPTHGPRALLVQFLSPGDGDVPTRTDWSGHENGGMGYFWYWTCFTHDNSEHNPIIVNCMHSEFIVSYSEFIVSYSEFTGLGIERAAETSTLPDLM